VKKIYEEKTGRKMKKMDFKNCFWKKKKLKKITVSNREMNYSFKSVLTPFRPFPSNFSIYMQIFFRIA